MPTVPCAVSPTTSNTATSFPSAPEREVHPGESHRRKQEQLKATLSLNQSGSVTPQSGARRGRRDRGRALPGSPHQANWTHVRSILNTAVVWARPPALPPDTSSPGPGRLLLIQHFLKFHLNATCHKGIPRANVFVGRQPVE